MMALVPPMYTDYASYFRDALSFLRDYSWIYNFAVTELLVHSVLEKIPQDWASTLLSLTNQELNEFPQGLVKDSWPSSLVSFCHWCQRLKIPHQIAIQDNIEIPEKIRRGLSPKKQHEVSSLAELINKECSAEGISQVLDMGSGLGYLDQLLHQRHRYSVIGLESEADRVKSATERQLNLGATPAVKYIICNISLDSKHVIESKLNDCESETSCMVGLHTCGDLTVNSIRLFMQLEATRLMILVPCCYHKMSLVGENEFANFPLSSLLRDLVTDKFYDCRKFLTRPFLRLASQETARRWQHMSEDKHKEHSENMMARAVLQLSVHKGGLVLKKKNRRPVRKTKRTEFNNFMEDALSRFEFGSDDVPFLRQQMTELWDRYRSMCSLAEVVTALQMAVQNVAESFVHADRAAYLQEHDVTRVKIVKVMDDALSPRCCALIAKK